MAADDDAPWLAAADEQPAQPRSLRIRVILGLAALATVSIIIVFILLRPGSSSDQGYMEAEQAPLIVAESGPFKVRPANPSGLDVEGQGDTMYAAGAGVEPTSDINLGAGPEEPLPRPGNTGSVPEGNVGAPMAAKNLLPPAMQKPGEAVSASPAAPVLAPVPARVPAPVPAPAPAPQKRAETPPKSVASPASVASLAAKATQVQLGAFSSRDRAEAAWAKLVAKHGLTGLAPRYLSATIDGKTLWRLRAASADPAALCARLAGTGDPCTEVKP